MTMTAMRLAILLLGAAAGPGAEDVARAARTIEAPALRAHVKFLASDLLEGRLPGTRGDRLARAYVAARFEALGLEPAAPGGGWFQEVPLVGTTSHVQGPMQFTAGDRRLALAFGDEMMASSGVQRERAGWRDAEVVFVGYGITAPEFGWDDFKGVDVKGKVLLVMNNDPESDPALFAGKTRLYYGRWSYKYEEAARRGAAGVIIIHTTPSASYPWQVVRTSWAGQKFDLPSAGGPTIEVQAWATEASSRAIAALGGQDLDALRAAAERRDFRPVPLGVTAAAHLASAVRTFPQENVAGLVRGTDPRLAAEAVVYSAHWDHFGVADGKLFNGAVDNASGCAALLAMAQAAVASPARRSQLFLFTFGEEQGLLGASAWVRQPPWPLARTVADLNLESLNFVGPSRDIEFLGGERSTLLETGRAVAARSGLVLRPAEPDPAGLYFRSDHFPFARAGVPALSPGFSLAGQRDYLVDPVGSRTKAAAFLGRYHTEQDDYDPAWDLGGMVQQAQFVLDLGRAVADAPGRPAWKTP